MTSVLVFFEMSDFFKCRKRLHEFEGQYVLRFADLAYFSTEGWLYYCFEKYFSFDQTV
jgi:hypothetical protein